MANYKKTYVLDTNVLIQDPESLFKFQDNDVVLADVTIEEMCIRERNHISNNVPLQLKSFCLLSLS